MLALKVYERPLEQHELVRVEVVDVARLQNQNMLLEQENHLLRNEHRAAYRRLLLTLLRNHDGYDSDSLKLEQRHAALVRDFFGGAE